MPNVLKMTRVHGPNDVSVPLEQTFESDALLGRSIDSVLCLPDATVSRHHAMLRVRQGLWYIVDEGSTTGTFLNRTQIEPGSPAELRANDLLEIGPWVFRIKEDGTVTQTIALDRDKPGFVEEPSTSRRLDALGGYLSVLNEATTHEALATATVDAALAGTGFLRGAILYPPTSEGGNSELLVARERDRAGDIGPLDPLEFTPSSRLAARAFAGRTAVYSEQGTAGMVDQSQSLAADEVVLALCVPILRDGSVEAILYLDSKGLRGDVHDAPGFCEDLAGLYAFALTSRTNADFAQRQHVMRIEFEHAKELRDMLSTPDVMPGGAFRCHHQSIPGMFVSADFFDTVLHDDGSIHAVFGDAAGHGLGASMLTTLIHAHIVALLSSGMETVKAVEATNRFVSDRAVAGRFVSLVVIHISPNGRLVIVDAGHGHWLHIASGQQSMPEVAKSVPIGVDPDAVFEPVHRTMEPGDRILLYTDGIPDQQNSDGERFGVDRLRLAVCDSQSSQHDVSRILERLNEHADGKLIEDDATIASIEMVSSPLSKTQVI